MNQTILPENPVLEDDCRISASAIDRLQTITDSRNYDGSVPAIWPLLMLTIDETRQVLTEHCGSSLLPMHTRQKTAFTHRLDVEQTYRRKITFAELDENSCALTMTLARGNGAPVCQSTTEIKLLDRAQVGLPVPRERGHLTQKSVRATNGSNFGAIHQNIIEQYADLTGDNNPLHVDRDAARACGLRDTIAHGALVAAIMTRELVIPEGASSFNVQFTGPVFAGDSLAVETLSRHGAVTRIVARNGDGGMVALAALECAAASHLDTAGA